MSEIIKPLRATDHCRHYSYDRGPKCAKNCDMTSGISKCMPSTNTNCEARENYTDEEKMKWNQFVHESIQRSSKAVEALPKPIKLNTSGSVTCPNCRGVLNYSRWEGGASIACTTKNCVGPLRFNIERGMAWPLTLNEEGNAV